MIRRKASKTTFAIYCWFIQVLIVLTLASVVVWLSTKPKNPKLTVTKIYIPNTTNQNSSRIQQNETVQNNSIVLVLDITNPNNGIAICYVDIKIKAFNGSFVVGIKSLEAFCQGRKKTVVKEVVIDADQRFLARNVAGGGGLTVAAETKVKFRVFKWKTKTYCMGFEGFVRIGNVGNVTENIYLHKTS